jgi:uroporphyrinogen decarboxylase
MALRPDLIDTAIAHILEFYEEYYRRFAKSAQGYFDVLEFGDDFASQASMLFSPVSWRRYFLPAWRKLFAIAHEFGFKTMMHSCGAIRPILPDLINGGLDIFEVVQTTAIGMDAGELKREFGQDLVFYGGMDVQKIMPNDTPADIRLESRRLINVFGKDGGYIFETSHFMMDDIPVENVLAMYDEGSTYVPPWGKRT